VVQPASVSARDKAVQVVWLKRDLRVLDHEPLVHAAAAGPVVVLYVFEPDVLACPESDRGQWGFVLQSLAELARALERLGSRLTVRRGRMPDVLAELARELRPVGGIGQLHSHQETGNGITYARDLRVVAWAAEHGVPWLEYHQDGVVRRLPSRNGWSRGWQQRMRRERLPTPAAIVAPALLPATMALPTLDELGLPPTTVSAPQVGGEQEAHALLRSFLTQRGEHYQKAMSSPLLGWDACSRLSPHLAHGTISMKVVWQALQERLTELRAMPLAQRGNFGRSLRSFGGRLHWHCHFMQKLEDEPALEFENMNRVFDGLRESDFDEARFAAFVTGRTGYPMVDACLRCLATTGWLNFRMRAMLVSFAAYHLWLHWRPVGNQLARWFVDYEPGIHWSQMQMQSGTTGINTVRIYSPKKQLNDQDPEGVFVRRWVPELAGVPDAHLAEPFRMTLAEQQAAHCFVDRDYPAPIVDHAAALQLAKQRIFAARSTQAARAASKQVYAQHGSRRRPQRRSRSG
jgi:deoxyribodipyrimidine photo-lyase